MVVTRNNDDTNTNAQRRQDDDAENDITTMKLYSDIERIDNELYALGYRDGDDIDVDTLARFDSMHYGGNSAVEAAISAMPFIQKEKKLLDIGSGFGGPARHLAKSTGCTVVAMELQQAIHDKAQELTERCGLDKLVFHVKGNVLLNMAAPLGPFDGIVSWLTFLHISDKPKLFNICAGLLKEKRGTLYCEDFYMRHEFTPQEVASLQNDVYCSELPSKEQYLEIVESRGFHEIEFIDMTEEWTTYCQERFKDFESDKERFQRLHSVATYDRLHHFYSAMVNLFEGENLGGVRLIAKKM